MAGRLGKPQNKSGTHFGIGMGLRARQEFKGDGEQRIARQHRRHLVKSDMGGGAATAQIVVIHAGQIVMHQRISVQGFDGGADAQGPRIRHAEQPRRLQHQEGAQPLAARLDGIAHGFLHPGLAAGGLGQHRVQGGVHQPRRFCDGGLEGLSVVAARGQNWSRFC